MADILWKARSSFIDAFAAANFNALANNGGILSTATEIDNSGNKHLWAELSFVCVTSTWAVSAGGHLAIYLLPESDVAASYPNSANGAAVTDYPGAHYWVCNIAFRQATLAHIGVSKPFLIPPGKFKLYVINRTGATLPSSSTNMTCKIATYGEQVA